MGFEFCKQSAVRNSVLLRTTVQITVCMHWLLKLSPTDSYCVCCPDILPCFISFIYFWGFFSLFLKDFIYLFLERGEEKEKESERKINVWFTLTRPLLGTWPATQSCALTGNRTGDPLVCSPCSIH